MGSETALKILQIVSLVSSDGAYGGPVAVAKMQTAGLLSLGHQAELIAGSDGSVPVAALQVPGALFRSRTVFRRLLPLTSRTSSGLLLYLLGHAKEYDLVHVHLGRDLTSLPAARLLVRLGVPIVVQTHGMVQPDGRRRAKLLDRLMTRAVLANARACLVLTEDEEHGLAEAFPECRERIHTVRNGVDFNQAGSTNTSSGRVVFCARLHPRKRPTAFLEMAAELRTRGRVDLSFVMAGPDEGCLASIRDDVRRLGLSQCFEYVGPLQPEAVGPFLASAAVFVLPSVNEPFPMTVLEALSLGVPTVLTESCGIARELASHRAAVVTDGSAKSLAQAVDEITSDAAHAAQLRAAGRQAIKEYFSADSVLERLLPIYHDVVGSDSDHRRRQRSAWGGFVRVLRQHQR